MVYNKQKFKKKKRANVITESILYNDEKIINLIKKYFKIEFKITALNKLSFNYIYDVIRQINNSKNQHKNHITILIDDNDRSYKTLRELAIDLKINPLILVKILFLQQKTYFFDDYLLKEDVKLLNIFYEGLLDINIKKKEQTLTPHFFWNHKYSNKDLDRPLIISIFGDVDSGKTTLISKIIENKNIINEIDNITQNISVYPISIQTNNFLIMDTPGHEAFKDFRTEVINLSDLVIIIVDITNNEISKETLECLNTWKKYEHCVKLLILMNKIDKIPQHKIYFIKEQLCEKLNKNLDLNNSNIDLCWHSNLEDSNIINIKKNLILLKEIINPMILLKSQISAKLFSIKKVNKFFQLSCILNNVNEHIHKIKYLNLFETKNSIYIDNYTYYFNCFININIKHMNLNNLLTSTKYILSETPMFNIDKNTKDIYIIKENLLDVTKGCNIFFIINDINFLLIFSKLLKQYNYLSYIGCSTDFLNDDKKQMLSIIKKNTIMIVFDNTTSTMSNILDKNLKQLGVQSKFFNNIYRLIQYLNRIEKEYNINYKICARAKVIDIFQFKKQQIFGMMLLKGNISIQTTFIKYNNQYISIKTLQNNRVKCKNFNSINNNVGILFNHKQSLFINKDEIVDFYEKC